MRDGEHVTGGAGDGPLDPRLRGLLVCPSCRGELEVRTAGEAGGGALRCVAEGLDFPVRDGVPWLVPELARKVGSKG